MIKIIFFCFLFSKAARLNDAMSLIRRINEFESNDPDKINDVNQEGLSALHYAVRYGHIKCMNIILKAKGEIPLRS